MCCYYIGNKDRFGVLQQYSIADWYLGNPEQFIRWDDHFALFHKVASSALQELIFRAIGVNPFLQTNDQTVCIYFTTLGVIYQLCIRIGGEDWRGAVDIIGWKGINELWVSFPMI